MKTNFTQVPNEIMDTDKLSPLAQLLYMKIYRMSGTKNDGTKFHPWLSLEGVGKLIGIVKRTAIKKYVDELVDMGLLVTKPKPTNTGRPIQEYIVVELTKELKEKLSSKEEDPVVISIDTKSKIETKGIKTITNDEDEESIIAKSMKETLLKLKQEYF
jgi:DNA-binding MarR family transcriptional regulator